MGRRRVQRAVDRTVSGLFGVVLVVVCLAVAYSVLRGVDLIGPITVQVDDECRYRTLTPAQLATDRWWETCE